MLKTRPRFACASCGFSTTRLLGRCPECGSWGSLGETAAPPRHARFGPCLKRPVPLHEVRETPVARHASGLSELDRVLGGGLVSGSLVLLGGDPGVGKSTLLLQALDGFAHDGPVLYVSGEESLEQAASRGRRLGVASPELLMLAETELDAVLEHAEDLAPRVLAVDSVQTLHAHGTGGLPGSTTQIREAATRLLSFAKDRNVAVVLVGHVTKDGALAGPRTLEHLVDVVLRFEGERTGGCRLLRAQKNRFGPTAEIGVFEMTSNGLREVENPSAMLLRERRAAAPGSAVTAALEGSRPLLVEVQALLSQASGPPRRAALGIDPYRVAMLLAVLERRARLKVLEHDVFVNVVGGLRLEEPASDLALAAAVASALAGRGLDPTTVCFGEIGLSGEVRAVSGTEHRLAEAARLGFTRCVLPEAGRPKGVGPPGLEVVPVMDVCTALGALFERSGAPSRARCLAP